MKKWIAMLLCLTLVLSLAACGGSGTANNVTADPEVIYRRTSVTNDDGTNITKIEYVYDDNGMPTEIICTQNGKEVSRSVPTHDEKGNILTSTYYTGYDIRSETCTYDADGNVLSVEQTDADGNMVSSVTNTYNENGDILTQSQTNVYDMGNGEMGEFTMVIKVTYDENGYAIRQDIEENGAIIQYTEITNDAEGRVQKQEMYTADGTLVQSSEVTYEENKQISVSKAADGTITGTTTRISDENDNPIEFIYEYGDMVSKQTITWEAFPAK